MEKKKQHEMCSSRVEAIGLLTETLTCLSSLTSDPLFSIFITFYTLILLYFPRILFNLMFSPILISTALLLSTLVHFGSTNQTPQGKEREDEADDFFLASTITTTTEALQWVGAKLDSENENVPLPVFCESMIEWNRNMGAPLEVIYEEYEGEEENRWHHKEENNQGLVSLSLYYPESDTESSSDGDFPAIEGWESPENMCFRWDEEDEEMDKDGLIEIPLDGNGKSILHRCSSGFQVEEENMIEIDIGAPPSPPPPPMVVVGN